LQKKIGEAGGLEYVEFPMFLRGFLEKVCVWGWFSAGENVVGCVVNVVF
jgi:hypothetical protein